jgi:HK97 gp10 family phage protein
MPADVSQLLALATDLEQAGKAGLAAIDKVIAEYGDKVTDAARSSAPVRTGRLKGSIRVTPGAHRVEVEATEYYAQFVEFGTSKMAPEPFMEPALAANEGGFADDLAKAAAKALGG